MSRISVASFVFGALLAHVFPAFMHAIYAMVEGFIAIYGFVAPAVIYFVLTISLGKFADSGNGKELAFVGRSVFWLCLARVLALIFAWIFAGLVFRLPWITDHPSGFFSSILPSVGKLTQDAATTPTGLAMALAVATVMIFRRWPLVGRCLNACADGVETFGGVLGLFVPLFLFGLGGYLAGFVMIRAYVLGSLLTGIACLTWHLCLLACCKAMVKDFSLSRYFRQYWLRLYPMLWATASESLSTPLNLHLVKKEYPDVPAEIRRFVIGVGSYLNVNGTMICAVITTCVVASVLKIPLSWVQLWMCLPVIFLVGFAVPGIPGELLLFAGPIAGALCLPPGLVHPFLTLYLMLQFGLPDSFRTGCNSTDSLPLALILSRR